MSINKFFSLIGIVIFLAFQSWVLVNEFSQTRFVEVRNELPKSKLLFNKREYRVMAHSEEVTIEVNPTSFWDYLLLTNANGNLLSIILSIATVLLLVYYNFYRSNDNVYWFAGGICRFIILAYFIGVQYTFHFFRNYDSTFTAEIYSKGFDFRVPLFFLIVLFISFFTGKRGSKKEIS